MKAISNKQLPSNVAIHEIGHALMCHIRGRRFKKISIIPTDSSVGHVESYWIGIPPKPIRNPFTRFFYNLFLQTDWMIGFSGYAAELVTGIEMDTVFDIPDDVKRCWDIMNFLAKDQNDYSARVALLESKVKDILSKRKDLVLFLARKLDQDNEIDYKTFKAYIYEFQRNPK